MASRRRDRAGKPGRRGRGGGSLLPAAQAGPHTLAALRALADARIDHIVIGGFAAIANGVSRVTQNLADLADLAIAHPDEP